MKQKQLDALTSLAKKISIKILLAVGLFVASLFLFAYLAHVILHGHQNKFDQIAFEYLSHGVPHNMVEVMRIFTFFGKHHFLIPAYLLLIAYLWFRKRKNLALEVLIIAVTSTVLLFGLKFIFQRERPHLPIFESLPGYSFPSGHALLSFVFCSVFIYFIWNGNMAKGGKWGLTILLLLFSLCVGVSRIVLRVHYATDVVAGFCMGYVWVLLLLWMQRRYKVKKEKLKEATA